MITELIPEQEDLITIKREEWLKVELSTQPVHRERAEYGVRLVYEAIGLSPPEQIIWVDSPLAACYLIAEKKQHILPYDVLEPIFEEIRCYYHGAENLVWRRVWDELKDQVNNQFWDKVKSEIWDKVSSDYWGPRGIVAYGQYVASYLAFYNFFFDGLPKIINPINGIMDVARNAGWWWTFENLAILSERPTHLYRDPERRLHNTKGMALRYPDGFGIWAINGVKVDERVVMRPYTLTVQEITDEPNAEVRRVMREQYGYDKYLAGVGAVQINDRDRFATQKDYDRDLEWGKLWQAELQNEDEPLCLVEVVNSTPEPDGSYKDYFLRVPPGFSTAHDAVAWTFTDDEGETLTADTYKPLAQT